jgi:hypothetical protein
LIVLSVGNLAGMDLPKSVDVLDDRSIDVAGFVEARRDALVRRASTAIERAGLSHYNATGPVATGERLRVLVDLLVECCRTRRLERVVVYADSLAAERHESGYLLGEVQTAINVLEEAVWAAVTADAPPDQQGYALGVVSTVLGAIKDRLACAYIANVSAHHARTLRLDYLFSGTEGLISPA